MESPPSKCLGPRNPVSLNRPAALGGLVSGSAFPSRVEGRKPLSAAHSKTGDKLWIRQNPFAAWAREEPFGPTLSHGGIGI